MTEPRTASASTDFRDARLHKALAHAPDGDVLPLPSTRDTIKNIANNSIPTWENAKFDTPKPWWRAFWEKTGRAGRVGRAGWGGRVSGPWNAAFAMLLLGGIITLVWQGQPVPDAVLDGRPAAQRVPDAAQPAPAVNLPVSRDTGPDPALNDAPRATTSTPAPAPESALAKAPQAKPPPQQRDQSAPASASPPAAARAVDASTPAPTPTPSPPGGSAESALRREAPALEQRESPTGGASSADKSINDIAASPQKARVEGAAAAPPSAPAPAPATVSQAGSVAERIARNDSNNRARAAVFAPTARQPGEWTVADVLYQGRSRRLATRDVQDLVRRAVALVEANAASRSSTNANANAHAHANAEADGGASVSAAPEAEADFGAPVLRLELLNQSRTAAVAQFDLWGSNAFRWQRAGQADVAGTLTPEAAAGLLAEAARALPP